MSERTVYELAGGEDVFRRLVDRFYDAVSVDPVLRPMYPEPDLAGARERLTLFLIQYWGGPPAYSERRGHPRLRARHMPFDIDPRAREVWLRHMLAAVDSLDLAAEVREALVRYFEAASTAMINRPSPQAVH